MAVHSVLLCLLWLHQLDYSFVAAQGVTITQRLCLWPQLETKTITCSSDGTSLIYVKNIVMTRLIGGLTTCATARASDAPELNDCRVTLGARDSYYADINRLCSDKPSCNIHGSGNVAAYVGQTLCGLGMENSTIRNLVVLTLQCYAVPVTTSATTATTRTTTTARQEINSSPVVISQQQAVPTQPYVTSLTRATHDSTDDTSSSTISQTDNGTAKVIAGASVGGVIVLFGIVALLVWLRRRGVARCCAGLAGKKRGRFGGSGGLEPLYDDVLMDEKGGDGEGGGRAVEQLRRMIAEEQSKQARKAGKRRASASASGSSARRRHRHRSSRQVRAESDDDGDSGTTRRRSHHRSAGKSGRSTAATSRHGGGHRHHRQHRSRHQHKQRNSAGRHRARLSSKQLADGGEWRQSTEISDDQSSIADVELLSCAEGPAVAGEEAAAGDEWVDETPPLGASATADSGLSGEGSPDGDRELAKPRSNRRPHHRRNRGEPKASRSGAKGAGKTSRSSRRRSGDVAATTTLDVNGDGTAYQPVDSVAGAANSRERRHRRSRQSRSLAAGADGAIIQAEVATGVQESDGIAGDAGASLSASALDASEAEAVARSSRSRRERKSESRSMHCRRQSDDDGGERADAVPTAGGEQKRGSGKSERAAKASRRGERSEGRSSRRHRDANDGDAATAASDGTVRVAGGDEGKRRRQRRVKLPKTKSRSSEKRSVRRKEYEMRRNDRFLSGSSASDSDVAAAAPSRPSDGCQPAGSHPSAELLDMMKSQQEQRRRRSLEQQQQQQSEKRGRRSKEKKSGAHGSRTEGKKRRTSSRTSAAATGGGAERPYNVQPLAAQAAAEVAEIVIQKDAQLAATSGTADVRDAAAVSAHHSDGHGSLTALSRYAELSVASGLADEHTYETLGHSEFPLKQENCGVDARNSTIAAYESVYPCAVVVDANQNMTDEAVCSICQCREESCECLNSVLVDAFSHSAVAPNQFAVSA